VRYILKTRITYNVQEFYPSVLRDVSLYRIASSLFSSLLLQTDDSYYISEQQIENVVTPHITSSSFPFNHHRAER
jgi:hypothetical protein